MKPCLFTLTLGLLLPILASAQITFPVCEVKPATESLPDKAFEKIMQSLAQWEPHDIDDPALPSSVTLYELNASGKRDYKLVDCHGSHPVAWAVEKAFYDHRPLTLSPDMIWLMIAQGFACHVDARPEEMRSQLVYHEGKKDLVVFGGPDTPLNPRFDWLEVFGQIEEEIARQSNPEIVRIIAAEFSTTGPEEKAAYSISLMDAMGSYFRILFVPVCGIPKITLEGTVDDWRDLERRFNDLRPYLPDWWAVRLEPILREFVQASEGKIDTAFWQNIYQLRSVDMICTDYNYLSGWIIDFFPYVMGEPNPWLADTQARAAYEAAWASPKKNFDGSPGTFGLPILSIDELPIGLAQAEVTVVMDFNRDYLCRAGFVGVRQDAKTLALRPEISWLAVDITKTCHFTRPLPDVLVPGSAFRSLDDSTSQMAPSRKDTMSWIRYPGKDFDLFLATNGPGGFGHYWEISVGLGPQEAAFPDRGFFFETSTIGWRTLIEFDEMPIPWAKDLDEDGNPELIVWNSFFAGDNPEAAPYPSGLIAWVYRINEEGKFRLDENLTRSFAARIAASYRREAGENLENEWIRKRIAAYLKAFSSL